MCDLKAKALVIIALLVLTISAFSIAALGSMNTADKTEAANDILTTAEPTESLESATSTSTENVQTMKIDSFAIGVI